MILKLVLFTFTAVFSVLLVHNLTTKNTITELNTQIDSAIVANRMVDVNIIIGGSNESGTQVFDLRIKQKKPSFSFGTAVTPHALLNRDIDGENYRKTVLTYFNKVTIEDCLKPNVWDSAKLKKSTKYHIDSVFSALKWLQAHDLPIRGHNLINNNIKIFIERKDVKKGSSNEKEYVENVITSSVSDRLIHTKNWVKEWDVINHAVIKDHAPTSVSNYLGMPFYKSLIDTVTRLSDVKIYVNESNILFGGEKLAKQYFKRIKSLIDLGCRIDGIGIMGHFHDKNRFNLLKVKERLDLFSQLNIPILITELDYLFGERGEVVDLSTDQKKRQAERTTDLLRLFYSHPAVEGVVLWGFWEGRHWYPSAALFDQDWKIKPNGEAYRQLVLDEWNSTFSERVKSGDTIAFKVHKGVYDLSINVNGKDQLSTVKMDSNRTVHFMIPDN